MELISEKIVEDTWREVATFDPKQLTKRMRSISKQQPHLLAFMVEFSQNLNQEVRELAIYVFYNVYRMFRKGYKKRIKRISTKDVIECYEQNDKFMGNLNGVHDKFFDRIARVQVSEQPYVMKYVLEALFEASEEEEDPISLTEEDTGYLFLLLKTVIDLLIKKTNA